MIPLQYPWQSHSRAAHGKKIDTPSLGWSCFARSAYATVYANRDNELLAARMQLHSFRVRLHTP
jgi:hypothetical protein